MHKLTTGALAQIMCDIHVEDPHFQVIHSKLITVTSGKVRSRLLISDGKYQFTHAMYSGLDLSIEDLSIIKLKNYGLSEVRNPALKMSKVLLITEFELVAGGDEVGRKIGEPEALTDEVLAELQKSNPPSQTTTPSTNLRATQSDLNQSLADNKVISKISSLTPYHNKWVIKARVSNKSPLRTWSNSKGEGKLFSVDLMDDSGEIRCTAFRELADKFYDYIEVDKVYYISKCQLKPANKQFNTLKNDYEMTVGNDTKIEECLNDDGVVPQVQYDFVPIASLADSTVGAIVDVIGVCKEVSDLQTLTSRTTNRELVKRDVTLIDQSNTTITLTLWGKQAESFDGCNNPVVVVRGAKVGEFGGGKNLSTLMSSQLKINPDIPEGHRIKGWFNVEGQSADVKNLSERSGSGSMQTQWICLKEILDNKLGNTERGDYFQTCATILLVRSENALYKACPSEDCNKKIVDLENGMYRCEKCNREYPNFKYRLLVSMNIADFSGHQWVSVFSSEAEKILGKTAQELGIANEENKEAYSAMFQEANFKQFIFKCRAKVETYNDEERLKIVVVHVDNLDYANHNAHLCKTISQLTGIPLK